MARRFIASGFLRHYVPLWASHQPAHRTAPLRPFLFALTLPSFGCPPPLCFNFTKPIISHKKPFPYIFWYFTSSRTFLGQIFNFQVLFISRSLALRILQPPLMLELDLFFCINVLLHASSPILLPVRFGNHDPSGLEGSLSTPSEALSYLSTSNVPASHFHSVPALPR